MQGGPEGGPGSPWVPPGAGADPPATGREHGAAVPAGPAPDGPPAGPRPRRWPLLAAAASVVLAGALLVWLVVDHRVGERAPAAGAPTTVIVDASGRKPLRAPDTLGDMRRSATLDQLRVPQPPAPPLEGALVTAAYTGPDRRDGLLLVANWAGVVEGGPEEAAKHWAGGAFLDESPTFESFPRDDLDVRCTRTLAGAGPEAGSVCNVDGPRLEVVMTGSPTASRMASLLAEAHRKLLG
jgi:hypothetical protein